jgi:hypothetical protein
MRYIARQTIRTSGKYYVAGFITRDTSTVISFCLRDKHKLYYYCYYHPLSLHHSSLAGSQNRTGSLTKHFLSIVLPKTFKLYGMYNIITDFCIGMYSSRNHILKYPSGYINLITTRNQLG